MKFRSQYGHNMLKSSIFVQKVKKNTKKKKEKIPRKKNLKKEYQKKIAMSKFFGTKMDFLEQCVS